MLRSTVLRALAEVQTGLLRVHPRGIGMVGNQVGLTRETGDPEAVIRIGGEQGDESWRGVSRVAYRHVKLIRGHDVQTRIAIFPPKLMANRDYLNRILRPRSSLDASDHPRRSHEQDDSDENRNDGPRQFHLIAAIDLRRFATVIVGSPPKFNDAIDQQAEYDDEYARRNREYKK